MSVACPKRQGCSTDTRGNAGYAAASNRPTLANMSRSSATAKTPSLFGDEAVDDEPVEVGAQAGPSVRVPVLLPVALDAVYDYRLPAHIQVEPGCFVMVPFGPQERIGIVWDKPDEGAAPVPEKKIKPILSRLDVPPLPLISLRFAEWVARYTLNTRGMVARMMMSATEAFETPKPRFGVRMVGAAPLRLTPGPSARRRCRQRWADSFKAAARGRGQRLDGRHRWTGRGRHAGASRVAGEAPASAQSRPHEGRIQRPAGAGRA